MYKTWAKVDVVKLPDWMLMDLLILKNVVDGKDFFDYVKLILKTSGTIVSDQTRRMAMFSILGSSCNWWVGTYLGGVPSDGTLLQHVKIACYKGRTSFEVINELHVLLQKSEDQVSDMSIDVKRCYKINLIINVLYHSLYFFVHFGYNQCRIYVLDLERPGMANYNLKINCYTYK